VTCRAQIPTVTLYNGTEQACDAAYSCSREAAVFGETVELRDAPGAVHCATSAKSGTTNVTGKDHIRGGSGSMEAPHVPKPSTNARRGLLPEPSEMDEERASRERRATGLL
jgi:hypothetical protein